MKLAQPLVLSTDAWTSRPFDQISILRRIKFGSPPGSQGTVMRSVRKCLRDWVSVDKHHHISLLQASKAYLGTQSVTEDYLTFTPLHSTTQTHLQRFTLINTIPSPPTTLHLTPTIQPTIHSPKCPSLNHHLNHRHPSPPSPKNSPPSSSRPSPSRPSQH